MRICTCFQYFYLFNHGSYERKRLFFEALKDLLDKVNAVDVIAGLCGYLNRLNFCVFKHPFIIKLFVIFEDVRSCHDLSNNRIEELSNRVYRVDLPVFFMTLLLDF